MKHLPLDGPKDYTFAELRSIISDDSELSIDDLQEKIDNHESMVKILKNISSGITRLAVVIALLLVLVSLSSCGASGSGSTIGVYSERQKVPKPEFESPTPPSSGLSTAPKPPSHPVGCDIKGNISENGKIYHLPGQKYYDSTIIDTSRGERWFCTESEAVAAGWRKSRV